MPQVELSPLEEKILADLAPPDIARVSTTHVWIIEWLDESEVKTGHALHIWMEQRREGWSHYRSCTTKMEVLAVIEEATQLARHREMRPILHIEAHGCKDGLAASQRSKDFLEWNELTRPLQQLNLATRCNLVVFCSACIGYAGVLIFSEGPRAPMVALVGPTEEAGPTDLLNASKEFYRCWSNGGAISEITANAERETRGIAIEYEPFNKFALEALARNIMLLLCSPDRKTVGVRDLGKALQIGWDQMFMIDLYPENRDRFGTDIHKLIREIEKRLHHR